jgi:hypothetical protein
MKKSDIKKQLEKQIAQTRLLYVASMGITLITFVVLLYLGIRSLALYIADQGETNDGFSFVTDTESDVCDYRRLLDGVCVESKHDMTPRLVAVMIENHPDARPQAGLAKASVVYEAPVEANFSRFLVIYPEDADVNKAGPVRSARPYYLDWVLEYGNPVYMHVGGSPDALSRIYRGDFFDVNEMGRGWYFWRSTDRYAPHNTYTSTKLWKDAIEDYWQDDYEKTFLPWRFGEEDVCEEACVHSVTVSFSYPSYVVDWKYNEESRVYDRYQTGFPHRDQDGEVIVANTVIVQHVTTQVVDNVGRLSMDTVGSGEAIVFRGGNMIPARWKKENKNARTEWLDENGNDIALQSGKIWIEVVNQRGSVDWEQDTSNSVE